MDKKLKAIIYCRVLDNAGKSLLYYQEDVLRDLAKQLDMEVVGVLKEVGRGTNFCSFDMQQLIMTIRKEKIDAIIIYSPKRITVYDDLYEEFEMICNKHDVHIVNYKEIVDNLTLIEMM